MSASDYSDIHYIDTCYTEIIGGKRLPKDHPLLECLGTLDELNAFLGDAKTIMGDTSSVEIVDTIQKNLFTLMGIIAGMPALAEGINNEYIVNIINKLELELPPLASFAVPGVNHSSAKLHIARTVCRRAERRIISLGLDAEIQKVIVPYINHLSELLFLLARNEEWNIGKES